MPNITLEEAALRAGMTTDQLKISRQRGLPPGSLGFVFEGKLLFNSEDFQLPAAARNSISMKNTKAEIVAALNSAGITATSGMTKSDMLALLS